MNPWIRKNGHRSGDAAGNPLPAGRDLHPRTRFALLWPGLLQDDRQIFLERASPRDTRFGRMTEILLQRHRIVAPRQW